MDIVLDVHVSNLQLTFVTPTLGVGVGSDLMDFPDYFEHLRCMLEKERICLPVLKKGSRCRCRWDAENLKLLTKLRGFNMIKY